MRSIRKSLTRRLSIFISLIVVIVLLAVDIAVDSWVEREFNAAARDKVGMLMTFVSHTEDGVAFKLASAYLPEFEGRVEPEYFQIWYEGAEIARSDTLSLYSQQSLPYQSIQQDAMQLDDIVLPDGRSGRIVYAWFSPQIDTAFSQQDHAVSQGSTPVLLAYATSVEQLNYYLWFIDVSFALALVIVPLIIRLTVTNTVSYALAPLETLNHEIKAIRFSNSRNKIALPKPTAELVSIVDSLNHFIGENYSLFQREKRLTSDIAHELKTPVTELINLAEVAIKFPGDDEIDADFKTQVLNIGTRMQNIIASLMLMHKYSHQKLARGEPIPIACLLDTLVQSRDSHRITLEQAACEDVIILSNAFALESILNNLLANALQYSPAHSPIVIQCQCLVDAVQVNVCNQTDHHFTDEELAAMFEPLWQKDPARTLSENFGLGLSIAKVLTHAISGNLTVAAQQNEIRFRLILPRDH